MEAQTETATTGPKCSRCPEALDTTGYPLWCKRCRAKHQRDYMALRKEISETRGFAAGVTAMRASVAFYFGTQMASGHFSGGEVAGMVRKLDGPKMPAAD